MPTTEVSLAGEIAFAGRILDEAVAIELGAKVLSLAKPRDYTLNVLPGTAETTRRESESTNNLRLGAGDRQTIKLAQAKFKSFAASTTIKHPEPLETDFFFGAAANGLWHVDTRPDLRLLVNVSPFPISIKVAKRWEWERDIMFGVKDLCLDEDDYETITYGPGKGVTLNNLHIPTEQTPHAGSTELNKLFLRVTAADHSMF